MHGSCCLKYVPASCRPDQVPYAVHRLISRVSPAEGTMMSTLRYYAIDQVKGRVVLLVDEEQHHIAVPLSRLPKNIRPGNRLAVPIDPTDTPAWSDAAIVPGDTEGADRGTQTAGSEPQGPSGGEVETKAGT